MRDHIGAGEFKCVFMMEEIVAIRDIKYCPVLHKIFFYQFSFAAMFDNKCSFDVHQGTEMFLSPRCDSKCISRYLNSCVPLQRREKQENGQSIIFRGE